MSHRSTHIILILFLLGAVVSGCKTGKTASKHEGDNISEESTVEREGDPKSKRKIDYFYVEASTQYLQGKLKESLSLYAQILELDPKHHATMYNIAKISYEIGDYKSAVKFAKDAIAIDDQNYWYFVMLRDSYYGMRDYENCIKAQKKITAKFEDKQSERMYLAELYTENRQLEEALKVLSEIESETGFNERLVMKKQQLMILAGEYESAILEVDKLITANPKEVRYYQAKYDLQVLLGDQEGAKKTLEATSRNIPSSGFAKIALAEHYRTEGESDKADRLLKEAFADPEVDLMDKVGVLGRMYNTIPPTSTAFGTMKQLSEILFTVHPKNAMIYGIRADILNKEGKQDSARIFYEKSLEMDPRNEQVWQEVLFIDADLSDYKKMYEDAEDALEYFPNQSMFLYFFGLSADRKGEEEEALYAYNKILKMGSSNLDLIMQVHIALAEIHHRNSEYDKSDAAFKEALEIDPNNHLALNNYAYYLSLRKERLPEALKMAEQANKLAPGSSAYMDTFGWIYYELGQYNKAEEWLAKAIEKGGDGEVFEHYGDILQKLGNTAKAKEYWQKAIDTGQKDLDIDQKLGTVD